MTEKKTIVILEDNNSRVEWLRQILNGYNILAFARVGDFVEAVRDNLPQLALVIFDHDLGNQHPDPNHAYPFLLSYDRDGKCGEDAAVEVPPFHCPALVWSQSTPGQRAISMVLRSTSKTTKVLLAEFWPNMEYAALIGDLLRVAR